MRDQAIRAPELAADCVLAALEPDTDEPDDDLIFRRRHVGARLIAEGAIALIQIRDSLASKT